MKVLNYFDKLSLCADMRMIRRRYYIYFFRRFFQFFVFYSKTMRFHEIFQLTFFEEQPICYRLCPNTFFAKLHIFAAIARQKETIVYILQFFAFYMKTTYFDVKFHQSKVVCAESESFFRIVCKQRK